MNQRPPSHTRDAGVVDPERRRRLGAEHDRRIAPGGGVEERAAAQRRADRRAQRGSAAVTRSRRSRPRRRTGCGARSRPTTSRSRPPTRTPATRAHHRRRRLRQHRLVAEERLARRDPQQVRAEPVELRPAGRPSRTPRCRARRPSRRRRSRSRARDSAARAARVRSPSAPVRRTSRGGHRPAPRRAARPGAGTRGDRVVVRDHDDRRARRVQLLQQRQDARAGAAVEVAGRLVGEHDRRPPDERPRDRDALALAARELRRRVRRAGARAPPRSSASRARARRSAGRARRVEQPGRDVVERAHPVEQEELLEHEPDRARAQRRQRALAERRGVVAGHLAPYPALGRSSVPITCSSVDLPEPDGPTTATASPVVDAQRHAAQRLDAARVGLASRRASRSTAHSAVTTRWPSRRPSPSTSTMSSAYSPGSTGTSRAVGQLDRVAAALAGEQRLHRHRQHALAALDREADVDRRLIEARRRGRASVIVTSTVDVVLLALGRDLADRPRCARPRCGPDGSVDGHAVARAGQLLAARVERHGHAPLGRGDLGQRPAGRGLVADRRLGLADPRRARPEDDLAAGQRAVLVEPARLLEALDRRGRLRVPVVVDGAGSWPSARRLRSSWRTSSPSVMPGAKSRQAGSSP